MKGSSKTPVTAKSSQLGPIVRSSGRRRYRTPMANIPIITAHLGVKCSVRLTVRGLSGESLTVFCDVSLTGFIESRSLFAKAASWFLYCSTIFPRYNYLEAICGDR
jgi:hypothetical protein